MQDYTAGSTSIIDLIFLQDSTSTTGGGKTGLVFNTASLTCYYKRSNGTASVAVTLATVATMGTFTSGGFVEIDATNMPGAYEFHPPNAAFASGAKEVTFFFRGATGLVPRPIKYRIVAVNPDDAIAGGLSALPATACTTNASLVTSGTGTDQISVTTGRVDLGKILGTAVSAATGPFPANVTQVQGTASAGVAGYVGIDWSHVNAPTSTVNLSGTTVNLTNTVTTYTGNTPQTGDNYARIGAAGAGLTALGDTRIANLDAAVSSRMATYTQPTGFLLATFPTGTVANTTNITGGTITTATNLTNAPTVGDFTATMKTSLNAATPASVVGAVGSVTAGVTVTTNSDKTGYSLTVTPPTASQVATAVWQDATAGDFTVASSVGKSLYNAFTANTSVYTSAALANAPTAGAAPSAASIASAVWQDLLSTSDFSTVGSIGKLLKDDINVALSTLSTYAGTDTSGTTTLLGRVAASGLASLVNDGTATLNLKQLNVVNSAGSAIIAHGSGSGNHGIDIRGGLGGDGIHAVGGTDGNGIFGGGATGQGNGIKGQGGSGGGDGIFGIGGANGNAGIFGAGSGTGPGIRGLGGVTDAPGFKGEGGGAGVGFLSTAAASGFGSGGGTVNANLVSIDGLTTTDGAAILHLKRLVIANNTSDPAFSVTNSGGDAAAIHSTGVDGSRGLFIKGWGYGNGLHSEGGEDLGAGNGPGGGALFLGGSDHGSGYGADGVLMLGTFSATVQGQGGVGCLMSGQGGGVGGVTGLYVSGIDAPGALFSAGGGVGGDGLIITSAGSGNHDIALLGSHDILGNLAGTIAGLTPAALTQFFTTDSGKVFTDAITGSVVKEIATHAAGADPLAVSVPGSYGAGTVGYIVGTNLDAKVSTAGGGLNAAGVRSAIGMASANLDTQIGTLSTFNATDYARNNVAPSWYGSSPTLPGGVVVAGSTASAVILSGLAPGQSFVGSGSRGPQKLLDNTMPGGLQRAEYRTILSQSFDSGTGHYTLQLGTDATAGEGGPLSATPTTGATLYICS